MNLDLEQFLVDWHCDPDALCARVAHASDGTPLIQLRVDLGLLQMFMDGRPDGERCHGLPGALEHLEREQRLGRTPTPDDWRELARELQQFNYRRLALSNLTDAALDEEDLELARQYLQRTLRDIDRSLQTLDLMRAERDPGEGPLLHLAPILVFNRARLRSRLHAAQHDYDAAVEEAERGALELEQTLAQFGFEHDGDDPDPGFAYLRQMGQRLRQAHGISQTLREQLEAAIEREDFETASLLRDALRERGRQQIPRQLPAPNDPAAGK